jgi:hypothetical protein
MQRRQFIRAGAGLLAGLSVGCTSTGANYKRLSSGVLVPPLAPIQATPDRIITMNVCTRPFRAQGPRQEREMIGDKTVIHNYGHGGSGWSLSWGAAEYATRIALANKATKIAVVGCGAIGLTTAIQAQRAGLDVTIYAKERPPYVRSSFATGIWSPDSRIVRADHASALADRWEWMARFSHRRFQSLLGLSGHPVEWAPIYQLSDTPFNSGGHHGSSEEPEYPDFSGKLTPELTPDFTQIPTEMNPFSVANVRRYPLLMFNISGYSRLLVDDFTRNGGKIIDRELSSADDFAHFEEQTIINCTGYGARALLNDESITPVRGQTCKLIPQPKVNYGIQYFSKKVSVYPRRDGLLVQSKGQGDFGNPVANIDPAESIDAVNRLGEVVAGMKFGPINKKPKHKKHNKV